jgi:hypothetical protein
MSKVEGEEAGRWDAVLTASYVTINRGLLTFADTETGKVKWKDTAGQEIEKEFGAHMVKLVQRSHYGRG